MTSLIQFLAIWIIIEKYDKPQIHSGKDYYELVYYKLTFEIHDKSIHDGDTCTGLDLPI